MEGHCDGGALRPPARQRIDNAELCECAPLMDRVAETEPQA
jgi:hypothetical protein